MAKNAGKPPAQPRPKSLPEPTTQRVGIWQKLAILGPFVTFLVSVLLLYSQWRYTEIAQDTYNVANRPYIGVDAVICIKNDLQKQLAINAVFRNSGSVPASHLKVTCTMRVNGVEMPSPRYNDESDVMFPQQTNVTQAEVDGPQYDDVIAGKSIVEIITDFQYSGPGGKHYHSSQAQRYMPAQNRFFVTGGELDE